jgi:N-methylhydantoinase A
MRGGYERALSFDMGGTTAKITLIDDYTPQQSRHFEVARAYRFAKGSGIPVRIPVIDMVEIGAGGGSIARVDQLRRIVVGPDSAGSEPGPACYNRGGEHATVTDADVALGRIDPEGFAGGSISLDPAKAAAVIATSITLDMSVQEAARGIVEIVDEAMASAARVHAVENGKDTAGRTMIAFGGAAPLHAARLAAKLGIERVVVPQDAGVGSAHGFLDAPIAYEVVRTLLVRLDALDQTRIDTMFAEMRAEAEAVVRLGFPAGDLRETRTAYMRYRGQGHEIAVPFPSGMADPETLRAAFDTTYTVLFGRIIPGLQIEVVTWTLGLAQQNDRPERSISPSPKAPPIPIGTRRIVEAETGEPVMAELHIRSALGPGMTVTGPAAILEDGTTTIVPSGRHAHIGTDHEIIIEGSPP